MIGWFTHKSKILDDDHKTDEGFFDSYLDEKLSIQQNFEEIERIYYEDAMTKRCISIFSISVLFVVFLISVVYMMSVVGAPFLTLASCVLAAIYMLFLGVLVLGAGGKIKRYGYDGSMLYLMQYQYEHCLVNHLKTHVNMSHDDAIKLLKDVRDKTSETLLDYADKSHKKLTADEESE